MTARNAASDPAPADGPAPLPGVPTGHTVQERFWIFQRLAWLGLAVLILAALAGFTGQGGPGARTVVQGANARLDHPRFSRWETSDDMRLTLPPGVGETAEVEIGQPFFDHFEIEDVQPQPQAHRATATGTKMIFALESPARERRIVFHIRATRPSPGAPVRLRVNGGPALVFTPIVLP